MMTTAQDFQEAINDFASSVASCDDTATVVNRAHARGPRVHRGLRRHSRVLGISLGQLLGGPSSKARV